MATYDPERQAAIEYIRALRNAEESSVTNKHSAILVTTGDLQTPYKIIGPIFFHVSNKKTFGSSQLDKLQKHYQQEIEKIRKQGQVGAVEPDFGFLIGDWTVGQNDFDVAFYIAVQELKKRAAVLEADAIIAMRQDIVIDRATFGYFYLQMYGTAVKFA